MSVHHCNYCDEDVDVTPAAGDPSKVAELLIAHLRLVCSKAPGALEFGTVAEAQASAELAGAVPSAGHWAASAAQHFEQWDLVSMGGVLLSTHHERMCKPPCCIHSPSAHHMRPWPQQWSQRVGVVFRECPHGEHHPDPDDLRARTGHLLHRCDGCCLPPQDDGRLAGVGVHE